VFNKLKYLFFAIGLFGLLMAQASGNSGIGVSYSNPRNTVCGSTGNIIDFTCNMMKALLELGPMVSILALVLAGLVYVYASVFVTADQRGRYHTLATNLALGAIVLAAIVGGAGLITQNGEKFLTTQATTGSG
jgi:hypothetical protein